MQPRRAWRALRPLEWSLAALIALAGCYAGSFVATFAWWWQDIDGPTPIVARLGVWAMGLAILAPSLVLARWCYRGRPWAMPAEAISA